METKLKTLRKAAGIRLREVAARIGVSQSAVHEAEIHGLRTPRAAAKYAAAFPGKTWLDLMDAPACEQQIYNK